MDQRIARTREAIFRAYAELLAQYDDVSQISVKELSQKAGVSRSTFYSHYKDMSELTRDLTAELAEHLIGIFAEHAERLYQPDGLNHALRQALSYLRSRGAVARQILLDESPEELLSPIVNTIENFVLEDYRSQHKPVENQLARSITLLWAYGIYGIIKEWFRDGCQDSTDEVVSNICSALASCGSLTGLQGTE